MLEGIPEDGKPVKWPKGENLDSVFLGRLFGHLYAQFVKTAESHWIQFNSIPVSSRPNLQLPTLVDLQKQFVPLLAEMVFKRHPEDFLAFQAAFEEARKGTFDKHGGYKETQLTPVYRKIFASWEEIEGFSGPKDLTHFLLKDKENADFYAAYSSVKMMCSRLGIAFAKPVKEI
jgi:hypothetical protein